MRETDYQHLKRNRPRMIQYVKDQATAFSVFMNKDDGLPDGWIEEFEKLQTYVKSMREMDRFIKIHEEGIDTEWPNLILDTEE